MIRIYILFSVLTFNGFWALGQTDSIKKKSEYTSIIVETFARTSTNITGSGRPRLEETQYPGVSLGVEYSRVSFNGFTISTGLRYRMLPISFKYTASPSDFNGSPLWQLDMTDSPASYGSGHLYIPLQLGHTFVRSRGRWLPGLFAGINFNHLYSSEYTYSAIKGESGNYTSIFDIWVLSPEEASPIWLSYTINAKLAKTLKRGDQFSLGLIANFSRKNVYNGYYTFYVKDAVSEGTYTDKGSYVGLQIGYSFLSGKKNQKRH